MQVSTQLMGTRHRPVDVQFVADPLLDQALGVLLIPMSQDFGKSSSICGSVIELPGQPARRPSPAPPPCVDETACAPSSAAAFGAGFPSRAAIAVGSREMCPTRWPSIVRAISVSCSRPARPLSANSAKAREKRLARKPADTAPAAQPAQPRINLQTLDQGPGRRNVEHGLANAAPAPTLRRPPHKAVNVGQMSLNAHQRQP